MHRLCGAPLEGTWDDGSMVFTEGDSRGIFVLGTWRIEPNEASRVSRRGMVETFPHLPHVEANLRGSMNPGSCHLMMGGSTSEPFLQS
jgi:hypothetical protein